MLNDFLLLRLLGSFVEVCLLRLLDVGIWLFQHFDSIGKELQLAGLHGRGVLVLLTAVIVEAVLEKFAVEMVVFCSVGMEDGLLLGKGVLAAEGVCFVLDVLILLLVPCCCLSYLELWV